MPDPVLAPARIGIAREEAHAPSCAVLVMSCDAYQDLWRPFFTLFWRYWADCPFPVYLCSNCATYADSRVTTLTPGDYEWSGRLRLSLEQIDAEYVLLLLEDFFLCQPISTDAIRNAVEKIHSLDGVVLRLFPHPGPDSPIPNEKAVGRLHRLAPYRVSTQPAIWNRAELLKLIRDDESIWDFEWNGTLRTRSNVDGFYSCLTPILAYRHVVERGQWFRSAASKYKNEPIGCDFSTRPVMSPARSLMKALNARRRNVIDVISKFMLRGRA